MPVMVVDVEPVGKSSVALTLRCPGLDVGPLRQEGPVEPLGFAIGLGPIGPGEAVSGHLRAWANSFDR